VKPITGGDVMAHCPGHADGQKHKMKGGHSLIVHPDGTAKCFAGCSWPQIETALVALGGSRSHGHRVATIPPVRPAKDGGAKWMHIESYDYGLAVKARFERPDPDSEKGYEKRFAWRLPAAQKWSGFEGKYSVHDMPLYGAAEIAGDTTRAVWFCEGEKATAAIRKAGEIAVCGAWGASQREYGDALEVLRGRNVILWPDNDQVGREYMREVRKVLRPLAKSITVVDAPVPPGGDAVEFFKAGGKVEDLLAGVVFEATVDVLAADRLTVRMPGDSGGVIAFEFADMHYKREALEANLAVRPSWDTESYEQFINLKSQSTFEGLVRVLKGLFADTDRPQNWTRAVQLAYSRVKKAYDEVERAIQVDSLPDYGENVFMVDSLVPLGTTTVFFGRGKSGKSTLVKALALEIAMGGAFLGHKVRHPGGVIVVDYEDARACKREFRRILSGAGLDPDILGELPIHFWPTNGEALVTQIPGIRRFAEKHEAVAMIVDSAMPACGGEPEKPEPALSFFNGLNSLGLTNLVVSHVSWGEVENGLRRPYGNVAWENMPRRLWAVHADVEAMKSPRDVMLKCTATNGSWPDPISYRTYFRGHPDFGPIEFVRTEVADTPEFTHALPMDKQLARVLADEPAGLELPQICEKLAGNPKLESVRAVLNRNKEQFEGERVGAGRGARTVWRLIQYIPVCTRCGMPSVGVNATGQEACEVHDG